MLSICIPIYNWSCISLVEILCRQCNAANIVYEIICLDDGSTTCTEQNQKINTYPFCRYKYLTKNRGRSAIRNLLALHAHYDYLLYLDCDAIPSNEQFIIDFIDSLSANEVRSGTIALPPRPTDPCQMLRHRYTRRSEAIDAHTRNLTPYHRFNTFAFLIPRNMILDIKFNESIVGYGHEDTLLALELERKTIQIRHIEAAAYRTEIDSTELFIAKTQQAIKNLILLQQIIGTEALRQKIRLVNTAHRIGIIASPIALISPYILRTLEHLLITGISNPTLLDLYKLCYYLHQRRTTNASLKSGR